MDPTALTFSVVIPTYNRGYLIGKTIDSILNQTFTDFEILIIDDGSTDNTHEIVNAFKDPRLKYFKKENAERGAARNYGAKRAKGSYINFFDSDDLTYPNHLQVASEMISSHGHPEFIHLGYDHRLPDGTVTRQINKFTDGILKELYFDNKLSCNGVFIRREICLEYPFEESRVLASSEDWQLWIRLNCRYKLHYTNVITSSIVNHDQRSLFTIQAEKVIARDLYLIESLKNDELVVNSYRHSFSKYVAERFTFFMLCLSQERQRKRVWAWGIRAFIEYPPILFTKRFLASLKNSISW